MYSPSSFKYKPVKIKALNVVTYEQKNYTVENNNPKSQSEIISNCVAGNKMKSNYFTALA